MTMWRVNKLTRTPSLDPDPVTWSGTVELRDQDTGQLVHKSIGLPHATWGDPALITAYFCFAYNITYSPNDFGCA